MKTLFMSQEVWEIVQNRYHEVEDTSTLEQSQKDTLKESRKKNAKASMYIQQEVGDTILPRVIHFPKAKEAWDILQKEYGGNKKVRELKLQSYIRDFENLKMKDNEKVNEFSSRVIEIVKQILMCGEKLDEKRICEKILNCLVEKFEPIVAVLEATKVFSTLESQELWAQLIVCEERVSRHAEKSIENVFQSKMNLASKNSAMKRNEYKGDSSSNYKGKGKYNREGASSNNHKRVNHRREIFARRIVTWRRIVGAKENLNVNIARSMDIWRRIVETKMMKNKPVERKKGKKNKKKIMLVKVLWRLPRVKYGL
ncbi:uncharacterized protein LOC113325151 [Papaver somniferum]|uniref:uncharacterized protein LOC113325151 n=1 Tax=Papaver somniferum TaxID=3469 RepID=UPI000E6F7822|nr:uncharacterized protein LOC113325151 [Papaver somniferum]